MQDHLAASYWNAYGFGDYVDGAPWNVTRIREWVLASRPPACHNEPRAFACAMTMVQPQWAMPQGLLVRSAHAPMPPPNMSYPLGASVQLYCPLRVTGEYPAHDPMVRAAYEAWKVAAHMPRGFKLSLARVSPLRVDSPAFLRSTWIPGASLAWPPGC